MKKSILLIVMLLVGVITMGAQTTKVSAKSSKKQSDWQVVQTVQIPQGVTVHQKPTSKGNTKYYIIIDSDTEVTMSKSNYDKYRAGKPVELIKSKNAKTGKFKYSTRSVKVEKPNKDINLSLVF